jgi:N-ethylmaleimide reductase
MKTETATVAEPTLFSPVQLGPYALVHRVVMPPLTRQRSSPGAIPNELMVEYYTQRVTEGGFMVTEGTVVAPNGQGYLGAPGIYDDAQGAGWQKITQAVHAKGGRIFLQLWHVGRQSHVDLQPDGVLPIGPSVVAHDDLAFTANGWVPVSQNRALDIAEIPALVEAFRQGAERAKAAGFDGVEVHGANGYLIDQFLQDSANHRTDAYGGSIENRTRFLLEVVSAVVAVWGGDRVGVRLAPNGTYGSMGDSNWEALFGYAAEQLNQFGLAYLHLVEPRFDGNTNVVSQQPFVATTLRKLFTGPIIVAGGFTRESAQQILAQGDADLVGFGRFFVSNPDLVRRLRLDLPLNPYDQQTFYGGDAHGYTDYPFYDASGDSAAN